MNKTILHGVHSELGASFTDFGGWDMPVRYGSDLAEHNAVRTSAGLFDISHMGEIFISGPEAGSYLDSKLINASSAIKIGKAKYSMLLNESAGIIDDLIVYRLAEEKFLIVANASNKDAVFEDLKNHDFDCRVEDQSDQWSMIALQGPKSNEVINRHTKTEVGIGYYSIEENQIESNEVLIARTGYTGEDGFEIYCQNNAAIAIWKILVDAPEVTPCGLAARDSLRLEAGMPLYGNELDAETQPAEAGLAKVVSNPGDFQGSKNLSSPTKKLIGLMGDGKRAARAGYKLFQGDQEIGEITSGILSPTLAKPIAMAYTTELTLEPGEKIMVDIRGNMQEFFVTALPFYKRGS